MSLCPHGIKLGMCTSCLESEIHDKNWAQGFSLNPYSNELGRDTEIGRLVHDLKYAKHYSSEEISAFSDQLATRLKNFIRIAFPYPGRPFDSVVVPPSNFESKTFELMPFLADALKPGKIENLSHLIIQTREVAPLKGLRSLHERYVAIHESMRVDKAEIHPRGILILDDVYEFGTTAREVARALEQAFPGVPRYYIALTKKRGW